MNNKALKKITGLLTVFLLTFSLVITTHTPALSQFPLFLPSTTTEHQSQTPWWNVNRAHICGASSWCNKVYLGTKLSFKGELTLGASRNLEQDDRETSLILERRARLVQESFHLGIRNVARNETFPQTPPQNNWHFWRLFNPDKPQHPLLPQIKVGIENQQTVIYAPAQPELRIPQVSLVTVTRRDAIVNGTTVEELAPTWRDQILQASNEVLWGREFDAQYPLGRVKITLVIVIIGGLCMFVIHLLRELLRQWRNKIKVKLEKLINDASELNPEAVSGETISADPMVSEPIAEEEETTISESDSVEENNKNGRYSINYQIKNKINQIPKAISAGLNTQVSLQQKKNLVELLRRFLLVGHLCVILVSIGLIVLVFRETRPLIIVFAIQAIILPILWIGITLIDKLLDFTIDATLNRWAQEQQAANPQSNRYTMRVSTYSPALKSGKSVIVFIVGIYITILVLGINPAILAGAGAFAILTAFLSRNVLENMLNGILILFTDRYAVGDVVQIGNLGGAVESMNLYITNLRNLDGQLITIPNGQINTVINNTKDWSRVNLGLTISWDADIKKAMEIILKVCHAMQNEPEWSEKILEPVDILGVDDISHQGTVIRFVVKTIPSQQWAVARTLRLRLKQALDEAEITLGVPQQALWHHQSDNKTSESSVRLVKP